MSVSPLAAALHLSSSTGDESAMQAFPHHYVAVASASAAGDVELKADGLSVLRSASPVEFDGPGDCWSPETLLVAAVGDCLILTFRGVARASGLAWTSLECDVTGTLDRVERTARFVAFEIRARLSVPADTDPDRASQLLEKAERSCLISNSLSGVVHLIPTIEVAAEPVGELTSA
jgi:organic hydroperoxide reductase OsmC/OhrA